MRKTRCLPLSSALYEDAQLKFVATASCFFALVAGLFLLTLSSKRDCLSIDEVRGILEKAEQLEEQRKLQAARHGYKQIDVYACERSQELSYAVERSMALGDRIHAAYESTLGAIDLYHQKNDEYPSNLADIREFIPREHVDAFKGFRLARNEDGTVAIVTGLYGSVSFNLD